MGIVIAVLLTMLAVGVVWYPFLRRRLTGRDRASPAAGDGAGELLTMYDEIRTLALEHEVGAVDAEDYQEELRTLRLEAAARLRDTDRRQTELERGIEDEVRAASPADTTGDGQEKPDE